MIPKQWLDDGRVVQHTMGGVSVGSTLFFLALLARPPFGCGRGTLLTTLVTDGDSTAVSSYVEKVE